MQAIWLVDRVKAGKRQVKIDCQETEVQPEFMEGNSRLQFGSGCRELPAIPLTQDEMFTRIYGFFVDLLDHQFRAGRL